MMKFFVDLVLSHLTVVSKATNHSIATLLFPPTAVDSVTVSCQEIRFEELTNAKDYHACPPAAPPALPRTVQLKFSPHLGPHVTTPYPVNSLQDHQD